MSSEPEQQLNSKQLWHPRVYGAVVGFVLVGVFLAATQIKEPASWAAFRVTFETLNGATWPAEFQAPPPPTEPRLWFAVCVAIRTALNLAVLIAYILGVLFALSPRGRSLMTSITIVSRMRLHERRLVNALLTMIDARHPNVLSDEDRAAIREKAERLHDEIADELKKDHAEPKRAA